MGIRFARWLRVSAGGAADAWLVLVRLRTLTFEAMTANVDGVVTAMSQFEPFRQSAQDARAMFGTALLIGWM